MTTGHEQPLLVREVGVFGGNTSHGLVVAAIAQPLNSTSAAASRQLEWASPAW
jgi:hypothetical protein